MTPHLKPDTDMHIVVSWDIKGFNEQARLAITAELEACFGQRPRVKPLTTFHLVKVASEGDRQAVASALLDCQKKHDKSGSRVASQTVFFLVSPLQTKPQGYDGVIDNDDVELFNSVTG